MFIVFRVSKDVVGDVDGVQWQEFDARGNEPLGPLAVVSSTAVVAAIRRGVSVRAWWSEEDHLRCGRSIKVVAGSDDKEVLTLVNDGQGPSNLQDLDPIP